MTVAAMTAMARHSGLRAGWRALARAVLPVLVCPVLLAVEIPTAAAQGNSLLRNSTQNIVRATREQVRRAIVPQLMIRRGATGPVNSASASSDWGTLATAIGDNSVRIWDLRLGAQVAALRPGAAPRQVLAGPDGRSVVVIDAAGGVLLAGTVEGEAPRPLTAPGQQPVTAAALSGDGRLLILGQGDGSVAVWDLAGRRQLQRLSGTVAGGGAVTAVDAAAAPGGGATLAVAYGGGAVATWSLASGTAAATPQANWRAGGAPSALRVGGDGTVVVGTQGGEVEVWRPGQAQPQARWTAHSGAVSSLSGIAGGTIVSGGADGGVRSWRVPQGGAGRSFAESGQRVSAVLLRPDGSRALAAGADGAVRVFDTGSGRELARLISTDTGWIVVDGAGRFDGTEQAFQDVVWNAAGTAVPVDSFSTDYFEPGLAVKALEPQQQMLTPASRPVDQGIQLPPRVAVEAVTPAPYAAGQPIEIRVTATDQGAGEINGVRLFHNGKRIGDEAVVNREQTSPGGALALAVTYRVTASAGTNRFQGVALGWGNLESDPQRFSLAVPAPAPQAALRLTAVGIDRYRNSRLNLNYSVADANGVAALFGERARGLYGTTDAATLVNDRATRAGLLARLGALQGAAAQDTVVVFLSGHGLADGSSWYFVPHDLDRPEDGRQLQSGGISGEQISELLVASPAHRILLIIDACQSGAIVSRFDNFRQRRVLRGLERETGVHVLAATRADQQAPEYPELRHGLFTHTLLNAFQVNSRGRFNADLDPPDGQVTVTELRRYVDQNVPRLARVLDERRSGQGRTQVAQRGEDLLHRATVTPTGLALGEDIILTRR